MGVAYANKMTMNEKMKKTHDSKKNIYRIWHSEGTKLCYDKENTTCFYLSNEDKKCNDGCNSNSSKYQNPNIPVCI